VAGATVKRQTKYQSKTSVETTSTDSNGLFHFDAKFTNSLAKFMPVETVITQNIIFEHDNKEYEGWKSVKRSTEENSELEGKPLDLMCELSKTESGVTENGSQVIIGICEWQ